MIQQANHVADVCVVGGGMAGVAAALSAARHGATVVLMHDRPMYGGNASSECRVHICGADVHNRHPNARETGILEELRLANLRHNPQMSFGMWDTVVYDAVRRQENLTGLLNCSCLKAQMDGQRIGSVTGWQTTTQSYHTVEAKVFIDCSGDAILAALTGAAHRMGREARGEFGESLAPEQPDRGTMGMTIAFGAREHDRPMPFTPPVWAQRFDSCDDLPGGPRGHDWFKLGYWWLEMGGLQNSIADTERIRDQLLAVTLGVWDHIKNRSDHNAANWALDWVQFVPAKRESRRYAGRHTLCQDEALSGGKFPDTVAYGGWPIDEHPPVGFGCGKLRLHPAYFHMPPQPYGIPYGSLVHRDVTNLMFAGRCASCSHIAMSSTRVMGTGMSMGQAAGTAAAMAVARGIDPGDVSAHVELLQQALLADDCYLPGVPLEFNAATMSASLSATSGDPEPLRDGWSRPIGDSDHAWRCRVGDSLEITFPHLTTVEALSVVGDSALHSEIQMSYWGDGPKRLTQVPPSLLKAARVEAWADGRWGTVAQLRDNYQRLVRIPILRRTKALRLNIEETWGDLETRLFAVGI